MFVFVTYTTELVYLYITVIKYNVFIFVSSRYKISLSAKLLTYLTNIIVDFSTAEIRCTHALEQRRLDFQTGPV